MWAKFTLTSFVPVVLTYHSLGDRPWWPIIGYAAGAYAFFEFVEPMLARTSNHGTDLSAKAQDWATLKSTTKRDDA